MLSPRWIVDRDQRVSRNPNKQNHLSRTSCWKTFTLTHDQVSAPLRSNSFGIPFPETRSTRFLVTVRCGRDGFNTESGHTESGGRGKDENVGGLRLITNDIKTMAGRRPEIINTRGKR